MRLIHDRFELQSTARRSSQEWREVETPSSLVDVRRDTTWSAHTLVRAPATYNGAITKQSARELA